ncbi:MAG TPA: bifunctional (p)ppGpp synthetase/guanosine-3',5'-bis(diphosphate) 3'-pyrophosphohydrolase [Steroidobacteraceae bacterium]|jgi:GTP pyrophosphokinase|nr:bifunctional (p)ppGpp synthetase/guanosine-3',5'-bis(diphosphate) 3'-pyrophosphohydrolase [Steroidobacteraceae bacterium]
METATPASPAITARLEHARGALASAGVAEGPLAEGIEAASLTGTLTQDSDLAMATLLHWTSRAGEPLPAEAAHSALGAEASKLAAELDRLGELHLPIGWSATQSLHGAQAEVLRKMLLAVAADPRLVVARLAEQLVRLRHARELTPEEQQRLALETRSLMAPLANRLGVWSLKWELEDLAFRYLDPEDYHRTARALAERRVDRERYIEALCAQLRAELSAAGVQALAVYGRPKHIYSIWNKMQRKHVVFEQLFDVRAVRIVVESIADCYAALGVVHGLWAYIPGEFDDYIATPKDNDYRSIHTAVIGPAGKAVEVQIRSREMHEHAELGIAAHWRYKEGAAGGARDTGYERKIEWVRRVLDPAQSTPLEGDVLERLKQELFSDRVYAMTPKGEVVDLPRGATPLDFAYHLHTELGHHCRGAKINGRIVPLNQPLANGEVVEIIAGRQGGPSRDWLSTEQGFLASPRSRAKVRAWFRRLDQSDHVADGRSILERELARASAGPELTAALVRELHADSAEELHRQLGAGDIGTSALAQAIARLRAPAAEPLAPARQRPRGATRGSLVDIEGVGDLPVTLARCCAPVPPEPIAGYVTLGRGVTVHRATCPSLARMRARNAARVLVVDWNLGTDSLLPVQIRVQALDRRGLLRDVSDVLAVEKLSIEGVNSNTDPEDRIATIVMRTAVRDSEQLGRLLTRLSAVPNVLSAQRLA